jgi:hypothetical protein
MLENGANAVSKDILRMFDYLEEDNPFPEFKYSRKIKQIQKLQKIS